MLSCFLLRVVGLRWPYRCCGSRCCWNGIHPSSWVSYGNSSLLLTLNEAHLLPRADCVLAVHSLYTQMSLAARSASLACALPTPDATRPSTDGVRLRFTAATTSSDCLHCRSSPSSLVIIRLLLVVGLGWLTVVRWRGLLLLCRRRRRRHLLLLMWRW